MTRLTNSFHGTSIDVRKTREEIDALLTTAPENRTESERAWVRRVGRALCPSATHGCTCGMNELNER